jgi:hypothetical protein
VTTPTTQLLGLLIATLPPVCQSREEDAGIQASLWKGATGRGFGNRGRRLLQVQERRQKGFHPSVLEEDLVADGRAAARRYPGIPNFSWAHGNQTSLPPPSVAPRTTTCMLVLFLSLSGEVQQ